MSKVLEVKNLCYSVGSKKILSNLSFIVEKEQRIAIVGNNGSGKTTLLKLLAGILPNQNSITLEYGYLNLKKSPDDVRKIGCVFPDDFVFLFDDVYHELIFPLENLCYSKENIQKTVKSLVKYFDVSYLLDKKIKDLKEEEKALLRILVAIIHGPKLLVMDDPFAMMNKKFRIKVVERLLSFVKENHITLIFSTSNMEDVLVSDYVYVLQNGEVAMQGETLSILKEDSRLKKMGLNLPFMIDLSLMLQFYEILDDLYLNMKDLVVKLWK